jgi:hypothetical protein
VRIAVVIWLTLATMPGAAQPRQPDATAPLRCYEHATRVGFLSQPDARQLCIGATSDMPARCAADANDRLTISGLSLVRLCQGATSTQPARCANDLGSGTDYDPTSIAEYCAAHPYPLVPARTAGSPQCLQAAAARTTLSDGEASQLCSGSRSSVPVDCFERGRTQTTIATSDLLELCAPVTYGVIGPLGQPVEIGGPSG